MERVEPRLQVCFRPWGGGSRQGPEEEEEREEGGGEGRVVGGFWVSLEYWSLLSFTFIGLKFFSWQLATWNKNPLFSSLLHG